MVAGADSDGFEACLTENDALAYANALLEDAERSRIERHIDRCAACRRLVSGLPDPVQTGGS